MMVSKRWNEERRRCGDETDPQQAFHVARGARTVRNLKYSPHTHQVVARRKPLIVV